MNDESRREITGSPVWSKFVKYLVGANNVVVDSTLPSATQELVRIRASQINGCGFCLDMHIKDAVAWGETPARLHLVAAWRETAIFTEAERAALELTEQGCRLVGGVTDEAWAAAAKHFDTDQLAALVALIAEINAWNRLNVITQRVAGSAG
jgi:AhpD family alkylhydroperoxidase